MIVLVTGAGGYIAGMLIEELARSDSIDRIMGVDLKECPERLAAQAKLRWIRGDVASEAWVGELGDEPVDTVVHCAYQIRELYGKGKELQHRWNVLGAQRVFGFALTRTTVRRLLHLSTVTAYGTTTRKSGPVTIDEDHPLREDAYLYGRQKRQVEALLLQRYAAAGSPRQVVVLRLASVTGPRGRFGLGRYGLLSTIAGRFPWVVCGRPDWGRQFLHEDDVVGVLAMFVHAPPKEGYQTFNVAPPDFLDAATIGRLFGKRVLVLPPLLLRALFSLAWHASRGRIPTPPGAWKVLTYANLLDGGRLTRDTGYRYRYSCAQALLAEEGSHASARASSALPAAAPPSCGH